MEKKISVCTWKFTSASENFPWRSITNVSIYHTVRIREDEKRNYFSFGRLCLTTFPREKKKFISTTFVDRQRGRNKLYLFLLHQNCVWNKKWKWHKKNIFFSSLSGTNKSHWKKRKENRTHVAEWWWTQFKNELELLFIFRVCLRTLLVLFYRWLDGLEKWKWKKNLLPLYTW